MLHWLEGAAVRAILALPQELRFRLLQIKPERRRGQEFNADFATLRNLQGMLGRASVEEVGKKHGVAQARREFSSALKMTASVFSPLKVRSRDLEVEGGGGKVPARLYQPTRGKVDGALMVYFHGGGFTVGDLESYDSYLRYLASKSGVSMLHVEYRLAPENLFPAAPLDAIAAVRGVVTDASSFDADPGKILVGGDSAGAVLALVSAYEALQTDLAIRALWLCSPGLHALSVYPSNEEFGEGFIFTTAMRDWFETTYLGPEKNVNHPHASPLFLPKLEILPKTWLGDGSFDFFVDPITIFSEKLQDAGVDLTFVLEEGLMHDYPLFLGVVPAAREATDRACAWIREAAS